jgi:hypothetical protein
MSKPVTKTPKNAAASGAGSDGKPLRIGTGLPGPGRPPGSPNKATATFRETIQRLLEDNADNVALWLQQTAEGSKSRRVNGKTIPGRPPNPSEAARILGNLAEFAAPRLSRAEVTGEGGGPLTVVINKSGQQRPQEPASDPD